MAGELYGAGARALQDELATRRLADALATHTMHEALTDDDVDLIRAQSTVWLATVDADGWPDVSYKGGDVGFVEVVSPTELRIPMYDGNGMMRTAGNILDTGRVALLFVDTARPWRMRIHGTAVVSTAPADTDRHPGADAVVIVTPTRIFPNCGRYIHQEGRISAFVPDEHGDAPLPEWKRHEFLRPVLRPRDQERLAAGE
jgi:predicted pyridoxine 5'-phosphate oxidase superfamily flavin-nucleotide-binding protein